MINRLKAAWDVLTGRTDIDKIADHINSVQVENDLLAQEIRKLDDKLFAIQTSSPEIARKIIADLCDGMMKRKTVESKRIENILIPELQRTYAR